MIITSPSPDLARLVRASTAGLPRTRPAADYGISEESACGAALLIFDCEFSVLTLLAGGGLPSRASVLLASQSSIRRTPAER